MSWVWHTKKPDDREPEWNAPLPQAGSSRLEYLYAWERRCRGYQLNPFPVSLEPPFTPYAPDDFHADASALELLSTVRSLPQAASPALCYIGLHFPIDQKVTVASASGLLSILNNLHRPLAFEIVGNGQEIEYQFSCSVSEAEGVLTAARMQWPKAALEFQHDLLAFDSLLSASGLSSTSHLPLSRLAANSFVVDFGLQSFAYLPLACFESFASDPLAGVIAGLGQVAEGETAGLQVLFAPARAPWSASLLQVAGEFDDGSNQKPEFAARANSRYPIESATVRSAKAKLAHSLYSAVIRVFAVSSQGQPRAFELCKRIGGALGIFTNPQSNEGSGNELIALSNNDPHDSHPHSRYHDSVHLEDVLKRQTHRSGMLLSLPELAGFVHPPSETLQHPKLVRLDPNATSLPAHLLEAEGALLGIHRYRQEEQRLVWPDAYRNRHAYILGATRMGKSTLLLNMINQDIESGRGLCLIDPHGDLALDVLNRVPKERAGDVLYLDLSDRDYPLALGLLEAQSEHEQRLLCSDVLSVLKRLFASSWGDRLEHILRHAILTLLAASQNQAGQNQTNNYTLRDIRALLSNKAFRERVVNQLSDPDLKAFWTGEFFGYSSSHFAPLYNKLGLLLSSPIVRNIIAQKQSKLSFADVIQNKQILLVNLASSRIGNDNAHFMGALLVSKLQIAAMQTLRFSQNQRTPFTLYVDEFQNFVVSSFETILSEAGKAGLSLVMANQFLEQLSTHLQTAILSNAGTLVSFRVSSDSGRLLEREFAGRFKAAQLVSLNRGEAIARVGSAGDSFAIETLPPPSQPHTGPSSTSLAAVIREQSREQVCRPRQEVEAELAEEAAKQQADQEAEEWRESERKRIETERKAEEKRRQEQQRAELKAQSRTPAKYPAAKKEPVEMKTIKPPIPVLPVSEPLSDTPEESYSPEPKAEVIAVPEPSPEPEFFGVPDE